MPVFNIVDFWMSIDCSVLVKVIQVRCLYFYFTFSMVGSVFVTLLFHFTSGMDHQKENVVFWGLPHLTTDHITCLCWPVLLIFNFAKIKSPLLNVILLN